MKRRDAIGILVMSLFFIAIGFWSLIDAFVTGETYAPKSAGRVVRSGGSGVEFGMLGVMHMLMVVAGVIGLFVYVTQHLGRDHDR